MTCAALGRLGNQIMSIVKRPIICHFATSKRSIASLSIINFALIAVAMPFSPSHVAAPYPLPLSTQPHNHEAVEHAKFVIQPSTKAVYSNALQLLLTINLAAGECPIQ